MAIQPSDDDKSTDYDPQIHGPLIPISMTHSDGTSDTIMCPLSKLVTLGEMQAMSNTADTPNS